MVIKELLPLSDHAEIHVVQDNNLYRDLVGCDGTELLDIHLDTSITGNIEDRNIRAGKMRPHCSREPISHSTETPGCNPGTRGVETEVLRSPHLVLTDFRDYYRLIFPVSYTHLTLPTN